LIEFVSIILGFIFGIIASAIATLMIDYGTKPLLKIFQDDSPIRAQGQNPNHPPHEFYHLKVSNVSARWPLPGRRPAWACKATIEVFDINGTTRVIPEIIIARWPSQPEPLLPTFNSGHVTNILDPARVLMAQRYDVHNHDNPLLDIAIKYEGNQDCYIFSNESYLYQMWQNPNWRLNNGTYKLKIILYYERGPKEFIFRLRNAGNTRNDLSLEIVDLRKERLNS